MSHTVTATDNTTKSAVNVRARDRRLRILMLLENTSYSLDGRVRREANALTQAGYQVTVICPRRAGEPFWYQEDDVRVLQFPAPPSADGFLGYLWEYAYSMFAAFLITFYVFARRGFDVIHAHNPPDTFVLIAICYKILGKRFVFDHHDLSPEMYFARFEGKGNQWVYRALRFFERLSCRWADHVIATNKSYQEVEVQRGGVCPERITIVRNGPEPRHLAHAEPHPNIEHDGKIVIGYVGVMGAQDGVDYLIRALNHLQNELGRDDWRCVLVGDGDALENLHSLARRLGLEEKLLFTGWVSFDEVIPYIAAMDICVAPDPSNEYNDRSTLIKIMEYMAQQKPVVAFDLLENRRSAQDAAAYATPNEEADMAKVIARLMDDPEERKRRGEIGRQRVERELAWRRQAEKLLEAYECLQK